MLTLARAITLVPRPTTISCCSKFHGSSAALTERFSGKVQPPPDTEKGESFSPEDFRQSAGTGVPQKRGIDYFIRNDNLKRPMSPHLSIYQKQLPMMLSGTHRVSGALMGIGVGAVGLGILMGSHDFVHYVDVMRSWELNPYFLYASKFGASFLLTYHYINGIRHLFWDMGKGYDLPTLYKTGYTVLTLSTLTALYLATR